MRARPALPAFVIAAGLVLGGCGGSGHAATAAAPAAAAAETPPVTVPATPTATAGPAKGKKVAAPIATVAPEVVVPTTVDTDSPRTNLAGWQGNVVTEFRKIDARLVTKPATVIQKVRATCVQMETGMFQTKVVPIIMKRFSNPKITLSYDLAQEIYSMLLQDACYIMNESPADGG